SDQLDEILSRLSHVSGSAEAESVPAAIERRARENGSPKESPDSSPLAQAVTNKTEVFMRTGPSAKYPPLRTLTLAERVAIETREGDWYRILTQEGTRGWISTHDVVFLPTKGRANTSTTQVRGYDSSARHP